MTEIQIIVKTPLKLTEELEESINYVLQREADWNMEVQSVRRLDEKETLQRRK